LHLNPWGASVADPVGGTTEPTVLAAVWKYRWLVLLLAIAFAGLGWLYASETADWTATATLAVQNPRTSSLFDEAFADSPERYVEGQVAILGSRAVARRAVEISAEQNPPVNVTVKEIQTSLSVSGSASSDIVTLKYSAQTQREAITVVNAVAIAYQEIGRLAADAEFVSALSELDGSLAALSTEIATLEASISRRQKAVLNAINNDPTRIEQIALLDSLILELLELSPPPSGATVARVAVYDSQLDLLTLRIVTITDSLGQERAAILAVELDDPDRASLIVLNDEAHQRLTDLQARRDQLDVDADLVSNGVVFYSPAEVAVASSSGVFIVLGALAGLVIGAGLAVLLSSRRRRFTSRNEPELLLNARLLADVPNFKEERLKTALPVVDAPTSAAAESFRFVSASISLQQMWPSNDDGSKNFKSVIAVSAGLFEGKTVICANTALAAAREGHKVLVVDADFGNQRLTGLLVGSDVPLVGMTDVTAGNVSLQNAVEDISHDGAGSIHLLSRGTVSVQAPDFFASPDTKALFASLSEIYDLVIIDSPPLLRVAYATTLARLADRAMVVVAHGEDTHSVEELREQMDLVGIPALGYVYNFAPLRSEMTTSAGSMTDTLGESGTTTHSVVLRQE
jgi:Mrp family chromosome partitioning ATPase/uncharacterized protein involved in exopolysaccharide biosynthesis